MTRPGYLERLGARTGQVGSVLCLGIDPDPGELPRGFRQDLAGVEAFAHLLIEAAAPFAAAVKPNLAFFEAFGGAGLTALERIRAAIPDDIPVLADAKRGDIGTTTARHAVALFDVLGADAVTANPYVGREALEPLFARADRYVYLLCRTSNPGAAELQGLEVAADTGTGAPPEALYARVARRVVAWDLPRTTGLVVGATAPRELREIRAIAPGLGFLVPGIGAQGGDIGPVLRHGAVRVGPVAGLPGGGLLVNVGRGIARAADAGSELPRTDPGERLAAAARDWSERLPVLW